MKDDKMVCVAAMFDGSRLMTEAGDFPDISEILRLTPGDVEKFKSELKQFLEGWQDRGDADRLRNK